MKIGKDCRKSFLKSVMHTVIKGYSCFSLIHAVTTCSDGVIGQDRNEDPWRGKQVSNPSCETAIMNVGLSRPWVFFNITVATILPFRIITSYGDDKLMRQALSFIFLIIYFPLFLHLLFLQFLLTFFLFYIYLLSLLFFYLFIFSFIIFFYFIFSYYFPVPFLLFIFILFVLPSIDWIFNHSWIANFL